MSIFARSKERITRLRQMTHADIEEVRDVGQIAWSDLAMHDIGRKFKYPKRSDRIIDAYLWSDPQGCIVAEEDGKIIGSAFCHVWGNVGWIGPLEVLPSHQDHGVGKALLRGCEAYLDERGCEVIGLETMSHLPKHLHFYMSSGYSPGSLMLIVEKILRREGTDSANVVEIDQDSMKQTLPEIARLSRSISMPLDYSREAEVAIAKRLGNVYVYMSGTDIQGLAILHTYQRGEEANYSSIKALLVDPHVPNQSEVFSSLMSQCERTSLEHGKNRLLSRFSGDHLQLYNLMLGRDYMLKGANVRMTKKGEYRERGTYHITSWAG